jgi:peptide-methionine (R)-S-oxide reductase
MTRRQALFVMAAAAGLGPVFLWLGGTPADEAARAHNRRYPVEKTDEQWKAELTPEQYRVLREHGTEPAFTSPLNKEKRQGTFVCAACGQPLFSSDTKYDSGTGWPSFYKPIDANAVGTDVDRSLFMVRTEVHCSNCGGHLGHVFPDGPKPTGERYCMNGAALKFDPS